MRRPRRERGREPRSGVIETLDDGLSRRWAGDGKRHICRARGRVGGWDTSARWFAYGAVPWTTDGITERPATESLRRVSGLRRQGRQPGLFSNVRKDSDDRRADVVVYHAAPALVATLDRDEEFVEVPRVSGADHAATLLRSTSMCQDYGEYQKLESARPMSMLLERLKPTARRGSKPRCHWLTHGPHDAVAARLADLVAPFASVASSDDWMPEGFAHTAEAQLGYADQFLTADRGVVARIVTGPHDAHRQDPHWPMRYDTGRPSSVIRLRISPPRTTSLPCPAELRARRPSPMMDL